MTDTQTRTPRTNVTLTSCSSSSSFHTHLSSSSSLSFYISFLSFPCPILLIISHFNFLYYFPSFSLSVLPLHPSLSPSFPITSLYFSPFLPSLITSFFSISLLFPFFSLLFLFLASFLPPFTPFPPHPTPHLSSPYRHIYKANITQYLSLMLSPPCPCASPGTPLSGICVTSPALSLRRQHQHGGGVPQASGGKRKTALHSVRRKPRPPSLRAGEGHDRGTPG